jgi:hypothetical protein
MSLSKVVFPEPLGPIIPQISFLLILKLLGLRICWEWTVLDIFVPSSWSIMSLFAAYFKYILNIQGIGFVDLPHQASAHKIYISSKT